MKNRLVKNYTFDASAQTVTSLEFTSIERIVMIVNQTDGVVIYNPINSATGGTLAGRTLTLTYNTTTMSDTDNLVIYVDHPSTNFLWGFAKVVASGVDTDNGTVIKTGAGMDISQTGGNLVVTTGTTAYSESIIRSNHSFQPNGLVRWNMKLSQRIVNQNFVVEFVDIVGDGLAMTINSDTSITVTKVGHGFTASDVGKGIWVGNISVASCLPQRATIASLPTADTITLTVSGFPVSGSGTCSLFGYNYHQVIYSGTSATALGGGYNTQRHGWQTAHGSATIVTTATGHIATITSPTHQVAEFSDESMLTGAGNQLTGRLAAKINVPEDTPLYLQIRTFNGSTAPVSTTTMTIGFVSSIMFDPQVVAIGGMTAISPTNSLPVLVQGTVTTSGAVTMAANATTTPAKARDTAAGATDTGIPALAIRRNLPTAVTAAAGDWEPSQLDDKGRLYVVVKSPTSAVTSVAGSASNVTLLASTDARIGATIYNDSTAILYVKLGATASTSSFTVKLQADEYYEVPAGYTGVIDGIWASATGNARITQLT